MLLAWFGVFWSLVLRLSRAGRGYTGPHGLASVNYLIPNSKDLERENAGRHDDDDIQDGLYALGHGNEVID